VIPNLRIVVAFCIVGLGGYSAMSVWVLVYGDAALKGDVIGTWKSFAVAAFTLWVTRQVGRGQDEIDLDAKRADNTGKLADAVTAAIAAPGPIVSSDAIQSGDTVTISQEPK